MHRKWLILTIVCLMVGVSVGRAEATQNKVYHVKRGDTLWEISKQYRVDINQLKSINHLRNAIIHPGQKLLLPTLDEQKELVSRKGIVLSKKDYNWLVRIVEAEAGGEEFEGKVAVASVVLNRVMHEDYPDSVTSVIFDKVGKVYQFSPVGDGRIYKVKPSEESYQAVKAALKGVDPTSGALFFYNPKTARSSWIRSRVVIAEIGKHQFAY